MLFFKTKSEKKHETTFDIPKTMSSQGNFTLNKLYSCY